MTTHRRRYQPASLMMSHGYHPEWSEGAVKPPIFASSTFTFPTAAAGKRFFEVAYGLQEARPGEVPGLIYSRINNPDVQILEERLCLWDGADDAAVFESGMAAISTTLLAYLRPGDVLLHSEPLYGGTDHFIEHVLPTFDMHAVAIPHGASPTEIADLAEPGQVPVIFMETPGNPTNSLVDIGGCAEAADLLGVTGRRPLVIVDNTYLGPLWQHPLRKGADAVIYSATKYIGGHSDLIAGAVLGSRDVVEPVRTLRSFFGSVAGPFTCWLLLRSLETLQLRMERQTATARVVADALRDHPAVTEVLWLGHLQPGDDGYELYRRQCEGPGAMISFRVRGGEREAFQVLDALDLVRLAVSLGGTESLAEHPATMTHCDVDPDVRKRLGITDDLLRLSVGVEDPADLVTDLTGALDTILP